MPDHSKSTSNQIELWNYGIAVVAVATAFGTALLVQSIFSAKVWFIFFIVVIVGAGLGKGPAWLSILFSTAAVKYLFTSTSSIIPRKSEDILFVSNFFAAAVAVGWAILQNRAAKAQVLPDVEAEVRKRTAALQKTNEALMLEVQAGKRTGATSAGAQLEMQMAEMTRTNKVLAARVAEKEHAEDELRRTHELITRTQAHMAQASRALSMDGLTASIAHEVNQPLTAVITSARACERWLNGQPPNIDNARTSLERIIRDGNRASDIIVRIRALFKRTPSQKEWLDVNQLILEMVTLLRNEGIDGVAIQTTLAADLPLLKADRIQMQQVVVNLLRNAVDAMTSVVDRPKRLCINSRRESDGHVLISFTDSGVGLSPDSAEKIFNAFFTTKAEGLGMGLAISRSIIESHGGRISARPNPPGATFEFTLPAECQA